MTSIVSGILESASSEKLVLQLQPKRFSFTYLVREELAGLQHQIRNKDIVLETSLQARIFVVADKQKCREAIFNILDNAVRYTPENGNISVSLHVHEAALYLKIQDSGIGLNSKDQKQLFTKYFRSTEARKMQPSGTGIGLYVSKHFIEAHGGTIIANSVVGKGTLFSIMLPL